MLFYGYVFALVAGGILLGASVVLGGGDHDAEVHGDVHGGDAAGDHAASAIDALTMLVSLRFWTFFLAFFGLTGVVLTLFELAPGWVTGFAAAGMGAAAGIGASLVIRKLSGRESNSAVGAADYVGKTATVMVPVGPGQLGRVRLTLKGSTVDVLASTIDDATFATRDEVLVVEMDGTTARVARLDR
jgi:membrane protein implicated in regulation of membrane protease activity